MMLHDQIQPGGKGTYLSRDARSPGNGDRSYGERFCGRSPRYSPGLAELAAYLEFKAKIGAESIAADMCQAIESTQ